MNHYYCKMCGVKIEFQKYSNASYCSDHCRKFAYDIRVGRSNLRQVKKQLEGVGN